MTYENLLEIIRTTQNAHSLIKAQNVEHYSTTIHKIPFNIATQYCTNHHIPMLPHQLNDNHLYFVAEIDNIKLFINSPTQP